mmetsp:Transcript_16110/g.30433  ORF Transcript_16110/g.30433 Transcript_16110/m.30433 type:complete len:493 (-) Transcript_16110:1424-2902(-)
MGKKSKDSSNQEEITLQKTAKFSVLELAGITQPFTTNDDAAAEQQQQQQQDDTNDSASNSNNNKESQKEGLQGRRAKASTGPRMDDTTTNLIGGNSFESRTPNPEWIKAREETYAKIATRRQEELAKKVPVPIKVVMPDGNVFDKTKDGVSFMAWKTSPYDVACVISQGLADAAVVARVTYENYVEDYDLGEDGMEGEDLLADAMEKDVDENAAAKAVLWDLTRPLVGNVAKLELLKFESDADAKTVFWHSSAHMLGEALEHLFGCRLTIGPPLKGGFYYDSYMGTKDAFKEEDCKCFTCFVLWLFAFPWMLKLFLKKIIYLHVTTTTIDTPVEQEVQKIAKSKQKFDRLVVTKEEALELFAGNPFKEQIIKTKVPDGTRTTVYKCGDLIDLCRGPHVPHTGRVKAFAATRHSATSWLGDTDNDSLQRIYGISFPDKKMLKVWTENQELVCCLFSFCFVQGKQAIPRRGMTAMTNMCKLESHYLSALLCRAE